ncbi:MAG: PAS domain-containing sensor histidine kinase [Ignavibacteriaceae bacterium]
MISYTEEKLTTYFDTPQRTGINAIDEKSKHISSNDIIMQMLEGFPNLAVILDENRQIVAFNSKAKSILNGDQNGKIIGMRIGEAIGCIHAFEMNGGCGTSRFCRNCGAGKCNKYSRETGKNCTSECRINISRNNKISALDLKVYTSVLNLNGRKFYLFSIEDIADQKRKLVLERLFFHDILNTATAIQGIATVISETSDPEELKTFTHMLENSSNQLIHEIKAQRDLIFAESGSLAVNPKHCKVEFILDQVYDMYVEHKLTENKTLLKIYPEESAEIYTDHVLLVRSIGNLVKNALEAAIDGEIVKIYAEVISGFVCFNVWNDGYIPEKVQLQIFQRSFSTKGETGRGVGTYSVKLLVEQYLGGEVFFRTDKSEGTVFTIKLPKYLLQ